MSAKRQMESYPRFPKRADFVFLSLLLPAAAVLFLWHLDNPCLWQDEAQTALVSKTILQHGVPRGYDGKNFFSQELEAEYGEDYVWRWHTWLPFYVLAGFFWALGPGTFFTSIKARRAFPEERSLLSGVFLIGLFFLVHVSALGLTSPWPFFRYLSPLLPP